jgi:outer membrane protein assembly factor BamB/ubiquinone/menaquinone biosynthesis C-methylase UbiE
MNRNATGSRGSWVKLWSAGMLLFLAGTAAGGDRESSAAETRELAHHLIAKAGASHGLCSLLGCQDGALALEILRDSQFFLHVQDPRQARVAVAAKALDTEGLYGTRVLVERQPLDALLFADNTVDVVLALVGEEAGVSRELASLSLKEIVRVLRPGGRAIVGTAKGTEQQLTQKQLSEWISGSFPAAPLRVGPAAPLPVGSDQIDASFGQDAFGSWAQITKRKPKGMDAWSHWEHGPDNNPVSTDSVVKAPYRTQWLGGPLYSAMPAITTAAGGRLFTALGHIAHHRREEPWLNTLLARNGYNGTLLWSRRLPDGYLVHRSAFVATEDYFYLIDNDGCLRLDPETGRQIDRIHVPEVEGEWKYIALLNGVLYALVGTVPDSGETTVVRSEYTHWSWGELSPGYYQTKVPWGFGTTLLAYDTTRKKLLWRHREDQEIDSRSLVIGGGKIFFYCPPAHTGCLDAASGQVVWRNTDPKTIRLIEQPGKGLTSTPGFRTACYCLYTPDVIFFQAQTRMNVVAISSEDGRLLWTRPKTTNNPNMLFADDKLLVGIGPGGNTLVLEPLTGETVKDLGFKKRSCARLTATPDSFFCRGWPEGLTRYDRSTGIISFNAAMRPACMDGVIAANGMLYLGPWLCDCNLSLMATFGLCSAGAFQVEDEDPVSQRLEVSETNASVAPFPEIGAEDWPTYRASNSRNACSGATVSANPKPLWTYRPVAPFRPSAPTAAGELVFLCGDDGKVRALAADTGALMWSFATAGPVIQPPTVWKGRAYVGSSDGAVYCLEAATGRLLWRFRAAPVERRIMMYDRLCSTWPVAGGVLVQDGVAYAAAGVIDYDGTYVYALDAMTGRPRWANMTSGHIDKSLRKGVSAQGVLTLAADHLWMPGGNVISPACYNLQNGECLSRAVGNGSPRSNRGEEIGVFGHEYLIFGGRLKYSGIRNEVNPGLFTLARIGPIGGKDRSPVLGRSMNIGFGKIPPAWSSELLVMANGPRSAPVCVENAALIDFMEKAKGADPRGRQTDARPQQSVHDTFKRRWTAQGFEGGDAVAFAIAKNTIVTAMEKQRPRALASDWTLVGLDPETGKLSWRQRLPSTVMPGGLLINRHGQVVVVHEDGSVSCFR